MSIEIRKPYNRVRSSFTTVGPSLTKQHFKKETDINHILRKYQKTGLIDHFNRFHGDYSDLSTAVDFHSAMNIVLESQEAFDSLPSSIRNRFHNDPAQFLDFVSNPENVDEMVELGLLDRAPVVEPDPPAPAPEPEPEP